MYQLNVIITMKSYFTKIFRMMDNRTSKFLLLVSFVLVSILYSNAQTVGYTYKPLAAEGCYMKYSVAKQDTIYYIIATVRSDRMKFLKESTMMIRTFNGDVMKLNGYLIDNGTETAGIVLGNMVLPVTEISSTAQFKIIPEQFEQLKSGVAKIRLSTIPIEHERIFKKDKIGKKLHKFYIEAKNKENNF